MKSRSKRNRKRPRGGIGCCLMGDGKDNNNDEDAIKSLLQIETIPLSTAFKLISDSSGGVDTKQSNDILNSNTTAKNSNSDHHQRRRIRIIYPYPFTFATFAKQRWLGRSIVDIYTDEFGSYPKSYYESAIESGRILVSGKKVSCDYKVKGGDELSHIVHRHEPAVGLADNKTEDTSQSTTPPINIVYEDDTILVVDKPATLPIHPCGGYNFNSLFEILSHWKPDKYGHGKLFTIHRLDRLTSGLVVIAKSSAIARELSKCISERDGCEKIYLARVKGKFPLSLQSQGIQNGDNNVHPWEFRIQTNSLQNEEADYPNKRRKCSISPPCQSGEVLESETDWKGGVHIPIINNEGKKKKQTNQPNTKQTYAGLEYWMTNGQGEVVENACSLQDLIDQSKDISITKAIGDLSIQGSNDSNDYTSDAKESLLWLNFACPCRISSHKNGVCEAGCFTDLKDENDRKSIKPAQTSFILLSYDASSDTSLVLAKPETGRTHQIRLHLQKLGHPIANDHNYGGELWFGDEEGKAACKQSRDWLDQLDKGTGGTNIITPQDSTNADTPATEAEIYHAAANRKREDGESILDYIQKTCVWCARSYGLDCLKSSDDTLVASKQKDAVLKRTMMEYLVRSQGIWLHALQYSLKTTDDGNENKSISYRTDLPSWAK